jgi:dipeptidyl-peptidase 4
MNKLFLTGLNRAGLIFFISLNCLVQEAASQSLTFKDYEQAEKMMSYNTSQLVDRGNIFPNWLPGDRFWYRVLTPEGSEFVLVDPTSGKRSPAFDHQKLAQALSVATGKNVNPGRLPFLSIGWSPDGKSIRFTATGKNWLYNIGKSLCTEDKSIVKNANAELPENMIQSPDKRKAVFIRNYNLWVKDLANGNEIPLTTDGIKDYGYATDNAGWRKSDMPIVVWSPDSKKIATYQQDERNVSNMYLVTTNVGKPVLKEWKYPLPGDSVIITIRRIIIDVENKTIIPLKIPAGVRRGTQCDDISCNGKIFGDLEWTPDASYVAFVTTPRDHKEASFWIADAGTGDLREVFTESTATQYESGQGNENWHYMAATKEIIWYSERDNWGHLYLYDASTGKLKNQITKGDWTISKLLRIDEQKRLLYFLANGKEAGRNPYFDHLYKVSFDGSGLTLLTPEDGNHEITLSPSGNYFIDSYSKQDVPPVIVLRDINGRLITGLEKTDISRLTAIGWKPPMPIVVKARDGKTDLYGLMFTPTNLDPGKKYPVVNYIYPGPQGGSVGIWSFTSARGDNQSLAELGFIVIAIEGTCNPLRSKSFHDMCYGNMADNTLPDQIAGIKQLASKYSFIDPDRVGIWGHSGGGFATAAAMFRFPDFYKVGISESGNHDNRNYEDDWGERYIGLLRYDSKGKSNYEDQANENWAKNLKGKLLLAHGMMDDNVPPYNTLLVVEALIKANKDFDLVIFPNSRHGYGDLSYYMTRRRWDYFVKNLMGVNPPAEYELKRTTDKRNEIN